MDENINYESQIDAYVRGNLKGEELKKFEQLMQSNNDIQMEVRIKKDLKESFEIDEAIRLKERLKGIQIQTVDAIPVIPITKKSKSWLNYAAAIAIFAGMLFGLSQSNLFKQSNIEATYASYYEPYPLDIGNRGSNETNITQTKSLYESKQYEKAIPYLDDLINSDDQVQWQLYRGISYLESGNINAAVVDLKTVASSSDENWNDHGRWYLALAYIKSNNVSAAKLELEKLVSKPTADHRQDAIELLKEL